MSGTLDRRLAALRETVDLARGRLDDDAVAAAGAVVRRAGQRLGLGVEATVVALAGPTGAGKSSLFNALAGDELVAAGRRRPTTSTSTAAVWGEVPDALLDWLEVPRRHRLDGARGGDVVLLDLPDFDSVEGAHREEVERVLELADLLVWVVDPQKYADGAWHERYLRPMAGHAEVMEVVLNQADILEAEAVEACRSDLQRLLRADGLPAVPVHAVSARTGMGLDRVERAIAARVGQRSAAVKRLEADVDAAAARLAPACAGGGRRAGRIGRAERERLVTALAEASGVPTVVAAVDRAHRRRAGLRTGWPAVRWLRRLRPDPLRRLRLAGGEGAAAALTSGPDRPSLPAPSPVQRAGVATATRALAARAGEGLADPWPGLLREAATRDEDRAADELTSSLGEVDLRLRAPRWWTVADALQRLLLAVAVVGAVWLVVLAGLGWLRLDDALPTPEVADLPVPTLLLAGGIVLGLLLGLLARLVNGAGARRRARAADRALRARVDEVAAARIVAPVEEVVAVRERLCEHVAAARRR